ncbi:hypothetical protein BG005_009297 [Podila minutissima]|nr:hypothetical protein BG005_009297 [Podila minutissima]
MDSGAYSSWSDEEELEEQYYDEEYDQDYAGGYDDDEDCDLYSDHYGDFSVKAKAPPPPARPRPTSSRKPVSKNSKCRAKVLLSSSNRQPPLEHISDTAILTLPPEVLHLIFSYLDNTTLCHGVSYVSHQFNAIAKYYIECSWTLGTQRDEDILLEKLQLGKVNVLKVRYSASAPKDSGRLQPFDDWDWAWKRFRDLVTQPIEGTKGVPDEQSIVNHPTVSTETMTVSYEKDRAPCLLQGVKKLIVEGGDLWTPEYLPALLPFMRSIHTLVLKPSSWSQTLEIPWQQSQIFDIPLQSVLEACSNIDTLVINGAASLCLNKDDPPKSIQDTWHAFRLSRFITTNVTTTMETMDSFLSACPQLVSFQAKNIHLRTPGTPRHHLQNTPSLPIENLLQRAALLCPNLVDISITPNSCAPIDTFESLLAKFAQLFSRTKHLDVRTAVRIDPSWVPTSRVAKFLAQVTSIEFVTQVHAAQDMDRLLKHTHVLEHLKSYNSPYSRLGETEYPNLKNDHAVGMTAARLKRGNGLKNHDSFWDYNISGQPYRKHRISKLSQQVSKRLVHKWMMERRHTSLVASWRCLHLREVELYVPDAGRQEGVFRFLRHACPSVEHLTLHLSELKVRQADKATRVTYEKYTETVSRWRPRAPKHRCMSWTHEAQRAIHTKYWMTHESTLEALGGLSRLETLVLRCAKVPGVLCPKDFEFLRTAGAGRGGGGGRSSSGGDIEGVNAVDDRVFCPRLKELRVVSRLELHCGLSKEEPLEDKMVFVNALKSMRPGVEFSF